MLSWSNRRQVRANETPIHPPWRRGCVCACVGACTLIMCLFLDYTHTHTLTHLAGTWSSSSVFGLLSVWESANKLLQGQTTLATLSLSQCFWTCWLDKGFSIFGFLSAAKNFAYISPSVSSDFLYFFNAILLHCFFPPLSSLLAEFPRSTPRSYRFGVTAICGRWVRFPSIEVWTAWTRQGCWLHLNSARETRATWGPWAPSARLVAPMGPVTLCRPPLYPPAPSWLCPLRSCKGKKIPL